MSFHYFCKKSALAKLFCLQLFTYQCQFSKKVVEKRKYVTLYEESWGKQLKADFSLQCRNLGDCETKELLILFLSYFRILHSIFFICALPFRLRYGKKIARLYLGYNKENVIMRHATENNYRECTDEG